MKFDDLRMSSNAVTSEQMYKIEENGQMVFGMQRLLMMENAGNKTADFLLRRFGSRLKRKKIVAICGGGNNGGDTFVACRHLAAASITNITILLLVKPKDPKGYGCPCRPRGRPSRGRRPLSSRSL